MRVGAVVAVRLRLPGVGLAGPRRGEHEKRKNDGKPADRPRRDAHPSDMLDSPSHPRLRNLHQERGQAPPARAGRIR